MAQKFFRIPVEGSALVEAELNAFPSGHKVLRVTRELVERESSPGWAVCVEYMAGAVAAAVAGNGGSSRGICLRKLRIRTTCGMPILRSPLRRVRAIPHH